MSNWTLEKKLEPPKWKERKRAACAGCERVCVVDFMSDEGFCLGCLLVKIHLAGELRGMAMLDALIAKEEAANAAAAKAAEEAAAAAPALAGLCR